MNKEIKQLYKKINIKDILEKDSRPTWFFTNERFKTFLPKLKKEIKIKNVFSIAGGGDFILNCLSTFDNLSEINICDKRQLSCITVDLKIALIKSLSFEELLNLFQNFNLSNKTSIHQRIKKELTPLSKIIFDYILQKYKESNFLNCIKKSGYWYKHTFFQNKEDYLLYLDAEKYKQLKEQIDKINIYYGDFKDILRIFNNYFYDLIYLSNIFDNRKYCSEMDLYLETIKEKLKKDGFILITTQKNSKTMIKKIEQRGFKLYQKEIHHFDLIISIFGHYCYSFLLFKKDDLDKNIKY